VPADDLTRAAVADRRAAVVRAMAAGFTWQQIADTVDGITSARQAAAEARRGLADAVVLRKLAAADRSAVLELELISLASVQRAVEGVLRRAQASQGDGDDLVLRSAHRLMQIAERRHALLGLGHAEAGDGPEDELAARRRRVGQRRAMR
jgi:hypothetical protein